MFFILNNEYTSSLGSASTHPVLVGLLLRPPVQSRLGFRGYEIGTHLGRSGLIALGSRFLGGRNSGWL